MIQAATVRDVSYIGANMRAEDWRELACQLPDEFIPQHAALYCFETAPEGCRFVLRGKSGSPAGVLGFSPTLNPALWSAWAFGTDEFPDIAWALTKHAIGFLIGPFVQEYPYARRLEVRSIVGHDLAGEWLDRLGAAHETDLPHYGTGGETFRLYSWTIDDLSIMRERAGAKIRDRKSDVFQHSTSRAPSSSPAPEFA